MSYDREKALKNYHDKMYFLRLRNYMPKVIEKAHQEASQSFASFTYVCNMIKPLLDQLALPREGRLWYYAYANSLYKSQRTLTFMVDWIREHQILRQRWEARGLDPLILDEIDKMMIIHKANVEFITFDLVGFGMGVFK
jgi:hypothetical protein